MSAHPVRRPLRRPLAVVSLALASTLALAACVGDDSGQSTLDPSPTPTTAPASSVDICETPSGDSVDAVSVTGDFGTTPVVDYPDGLAAPAATERKIVIDGGVPIAPNASVRIEYTIIDATTRQEVETTGFGAGTPLELRASLAIMGDFARVIGCVGPGSRAVGMLPSYGDAEDVIIFVADVLADLSPAVWTTDLPVIGGTDDAPTVTLANVAPKTDLELAVLKEGTGPVVGGADNVTVHYYGIAWETGEVFDQSYARGVPATFSVNGVVEGFSAALIGQKVGSRVIVTMPPSMGYGEEGTSSHQLAGRTLVFLIDIIDTAPGN